MNIDNLVEMANRIGDFFAASPDQAQGEREIAEHLKKFWEPRMRLALLSHLDLHQGEGLAPLVLFAVTHHRDMLKPIERAGAAPPQAS